MKSFRVRNQKSGSRVPTSRGLSARGGLTSHPPSLPSLRLSSATPSNRHQAHYLHLNQAVDCSTSTPNRAGKNGQHPPLISICSARLVIFPCLSSLDHKWTGDLWTNSVLESPIGIGRVTEFAGNIFLRNIFSFKEHIFPYVTSFLHSLSQNP